MHDRIAELAGLRAELATCKNGPRETWRDKTDEVQEQIERVRGELDATAENLEAQSTVFTDAGQDGRAALAAVEARRIRELLAQDAPEPAEARKRAGTGGKRNTAAAKAPERADRGDS
ncbi:hypothetical protein AB0M94_06675 [Streptomyces xanthochromogenes]|uniref:hypothetical protein n=1 Tax=Streptomyces xanthochromogenes TaxID=67384 RepID=UPI00344183A8